jgi:hypothetical protein
VNWGILDKPLAFCRDAIVRRDVQRMDLPGIHHSVQTMANALIFGINSPVNAKGKKKIGIRSNMNIFI